MEWRDEGVIIGGRRYGETSVILEVMTRRHMLADAVAIIGSIDIVFGEVDR